MTLFWILAALLLAVAIAFIVWALWRGTTPQTVQRDAANLQILRDQIAELDRDLQNGLLTPELHAENVRELEARALEEVAHASDGAAASAGHKRLALAMAILLPLLAVGVYWQVGSPDALSGHAGRSADMAGMGVAHGEAAIRALEQKVADNPADGEALLMLARSYMEAERYGESAQAYASLTQFVGDEAWIWADYADAQAMAQGQSLRGKPTEFINKALAIDPDNMKALALAGSAAMERGDFSAAIQHWERLLKLVPADSEDAKMLQGGLAEARQLLSHVKGGKAPKVLEQIAPPAQAATAGKERITGRVTLDPALKGQYVPDDTVFVLARAATGPKMPLAILRKQVRDLPLTFQLDDSMAMAPQMKLSNFDQVIVVARISKAGTATPQAGDAEGFSGTVRPGAKNVNLNIVRVVQ